MFGGDQDAPLRIQCPCARIQLELTGDPLVCVYCHCDDCQVVHGAAYLPAAIYRFAQVRVIAGAPGIWRRKSTARAFCRDCGARVFAEPEGQVLRSIPAYLLPAGVFRPTCHMQCQHALVPVADDLPHYRGFPPGLGGSDERVSW